MTPFITYILSFIGVIIVYSFNWSSIYPRLSWQLILFLICTFIIALFLNVKLPKDFIKYKLSDYSYKVKYSILFIVFGFVVDFIYAGQVPLLGEASNYLEFKGIPILHVVLYTFTIFISIYLFKVLIDNPKSKIVLLYWFITFIPGILLVSRGMLMNIAIGCIFIVVSKIGLNKNFYKKYSFLGITLLLVMFYAFGVSGNLRNNSINNYPDKYSSLYIMDVGGATESFRDSIIPKPFFWGYTYIASPLANLQLNIDSYPVEVNFENIKKFILKELVPDFISKRIASDDYLKLDSKRPLITPSLTVATFYVGAFNYIGWVGMFSVYLFLILGSFIYCRLISEANPFRIVAMAMVSNMVVLCTFDNMISYSGMSFQLIYPIIWEAWQRIGSKFQKRKNELTDNDGGIVKVLLVNRKDANERLGGDTVQMYNTQRELKKIGINCDVALGEQSETLYRKYDIVHIFNIQTQKFTYKEVIKIKNSKAKLAVSPIWWNYQSLLKNIDASQYTRNMQLVNKFFGKDVALFIKDCTEKLRNRKRKKILDLADIILPNSKMEMKDLLDTFKNDYNKKCYNVYNGVDEKFMGSRDVPFSEELFNEGFSKYGYVTQVGRIELEKNTLLTIKACKELNIPLVLVGDFSNEDYKDLCLKEAASGKVYFTGKRNVDDVIRINRYSKAHILPSYRETPGLATLEAATLGCNIVTTSVGSTKEYFQDKVIYCDPNDYKSIKNAIKLAWSSDINNELKKFIADNYTWSIAAEQTKLAYMSIWESRR